MFFKKLKDTRKNIKILPYAIIPNLVGGRNNDHFDLFPSNTGSHTDWDHSICEVQSFFSTYAIMNIFPCLF